ncbi:MAG: flagellar biosynthesis anti-sigma factor FlgM [Acidobacteria bacterium]|nr:flagellar biosynthesis anti-sigma factor FlgM [Acidobacteriota bacterium]
MKVENRQIQNTSSGKVQTLTSSGKSLTGRTETGVESTGSLVDQINVGGQQVLLAKAREAGSMASPARLQELSELVASGNYSPDPEAVSESIINDLEQGG